MYAVDRIVGQKMIEGCKRFRVRWEGFPPQEDTWEPAENIGDDVRLHVSTICVFVRPTLYLSDFATLEEEQAKLRGC
jgi:hypothetical protein